MENLLGPNARAGAGAGGQLEEPLLAAEEVINEAQNANYQRNLNEAMRKQANIKALKNSGREKYGFKFRISPDIRGTSRKLLIDIQEANQKFIRDIDDPKHSEYNNNVLFGLVSNERLKPKYDRFKNIFGDIYKTIRRNRCKIDDARNYSIKIGRIVSNVFNGITHKITQIRNTPNQNNVDEVITTIDHLKETIYDIFQNYFEAAVVEVSIIDREINKIIARSKNKNACSIMGGKRKKTRRVKTVRRKTVRKH
jgi:hypothetical protein